MITTTALTMLNDIPSLSDDNYAQWKDDMTMFFFAVGADYLDLDADLSKVTVPPTSAALDKQLTGHIYMKISPVLRHLIRGSKSGKDAMEKIVAQFQKSTWPKRMNARKAFWGIVHDPSQPVSVYISDIEKARKVLSNLGCVLTDVEVLDKLLSDLYPSFFSVRTSVLSQKDEPDLAAVKEILLGSGGTSVMVKSEPLEFGLAARTSGSYGSRSASNVAPGNVDSDGYRWCDPTNADHCHRCGRSGHIAALCIVHMPQHIKDWVMSPGRRKGEGAVFGQEMVATVGDGQAQAFGSFTGGAFSGSSFPRSRSPSPDSGCLGSGSIHFT